MHNLTSQFSSTLPEVGVLHCTKKKKSALLCNCADFFRSVVHDIFVHNGFPVTLAHHLEEYVWFM